MPLIVWSYSLEIRVVSLQKSMISLAHESIESFRYLIQISRIWILLHITKNGSILVRLLLKVKKETKVTMKLRRRSAMKSYLNLLDNILKFYNLCQLQL